MRRSEAFNRLQPLCVQLVKAPSIQVLNSLKDVLRDTDKIIVRELHEYILFPLRLLMKQKSTNMTEDLIIEICKCTTILLSSVTVNKWETFQDIFVTYTLMLSSPENPNKLSSMHEELKLAAVEVLNTLIRNTDYSLVLNQLYTVKNIAILGHTVSLLLCLIQEEKLRNLRILAMECLVALSLSENASNKTKLTSGCIFASFLPRISTVLSSVITGDTTQGHFVTKKAIETWQTFLLLVMDDKLLKKGQTITAKLKTDAGSGKLQDLIVTRDPEWIKNTSDKLAILVRQVGSIKQHSSWRVRLALLDWAHTLLTNCNNSMSSSVPILLEVLVILSCDEYSKISSKSDQALKEFQEQSGKRHSRPLTEILEENLLSMATTLPRQFRTSDDGQKLSLIKIISGYLKILGTNVKSLLYSYSHLKRFSLALIQILELDCSNVKIVEEQTTILGHGACAIDPKTKVTVHQPRKTFRHFHNEDIYKELMSLLKLLGHYGDLNLLVDHFLGLFYETSLNRLQATLIINHIMLGTIQNYDGFDRPKAEDCDRQELLSIISSLIDEYLCANNFNLVTSHVARESIHAEGQFSLVLYNRTQPTFYDYNANILQICLFLEGIAGFAKILQKDFNPFLITVLYPMLEKLGDCSAYLSNTAYLALDSICGSCGYKDIEDLIQQNIDYLVNDITLRLKHLPQNPHAPIVLKVILQFGHRQLLPLIQDTITNILECLDDHQTVYVTTFTQVLHELCRAISHWFPNEQEPVEHDSVMVDADKSLDSKNTKWLVDFFVQYHNDRRTAAGEFDENDDASKTEMDWTPALSQTEKTDDAEDEEEKAPPPNHVTIILEVMSRVKHLLSSEDVRLKLVVLDTITAAVYSIQPHTDHLLPMVHQVWNPFAQKFSDKEIVVRIKAFQTLLDISKVCGSFIRKRTTKEVFPKLCNFLKSQSKLSHNCGVGYSFTQAYKMQQTILNSLGILCTNLGIEGKEVDDIATACIPYLSDHGHPELKKAALKTFESLILIEPDGMWLKLSYAASPIIYKSPAPMFQDVQFDTNKGKEYSNSIELLFKTTLLQSKYTTSQIEQNIV